MDELQNFNFEGNKVRTFLINKEPYFVGKDVTDILGYSNNRDALVKHVDDEDKDSVVIRDGNKGNPNQTVINESGLYSLILSSKLPRAKKFKRWVTHEVLPTIRRTGQYSVQDQLPHSFAEALQLAADQAKQIELQKPKVLFADAVSVSRTSILVGDLAKLLRGNGINIGANRLFEWLRQNGYLISGNRSDRNMPTQRSMDLGLFKIKETVINHSDGHTSINKTPKVTGKGQQYFINKFLNYSEA